MVPIDPAGTVSLPSWARAPPALTMTFPLVGPAKAAKGALENTKSAANMRTNLIISPCTDLGCQGHCVLLGTAFEHNVARGALIKRSDAMRVKDLGRKNGTGS
jgi:hypothetical protein